MYNFPFFPHFYPRPYYSYPQSGNMNMNNNFDKRSPNRHDTFTKDANHYSSNNNTNRNSRRSSLHNNIMKTTSDNRNNNYEESNKNFSKSKNSKNDDYDNEIIEILGIKLHQDDILLICLIFFLYQEGVKDEFLFIVLILLLLT